jgi:RNA-directed DNA polymerase
LNKGSAGVDGMPLKTLKPYIYEYREAIALGIIHVTYLPQPILVSIPKVGGKMLLLGIRTIVDRWLHYKKKVSVS